MAVTVLPPDLAVLMVHIAARQAASPTALEHHCATRPALETALFAPVDGAFNGPVARTLLKWKNE
ncbi:hypothetical protein M0208_05955 [Sphingomonas sp. SUN019]|uniref:hypothetical protein n=1 Tax=Sphingomonas sp. SUN019 TaxID=2937788 RepID=UPI002164C919|nr:hypothetical protein [Sphingomonas sp. SUN019]UVO50083.1 hypothetical protein M0208_05955 [Sphingomonas sp. SUN019]